MVQFFDEIPARLFDFLNRSHLFFVATAPLEGGSVNVSPKSTRGAFQLVDGNRIRYLDFTGSGNETISHLLQPGNGRITVMFINIEDGPPNIVRMYGKGTVHEKLITGSDDSSFSDFVPTASSLAGGKTSSRSKLPPGTRAMIDIAVHTCSTSCGYSVPIYSYVKERNILSDWATRMDSSIRDTDNGVATMKKYKKTIPHDKLLFLGEKQEGRPAQTWLEAYWIWNNGLSIDGLPGLRVSQDLADEEEKRSLLEKRAAHDRWEPARTTSPTITFTPSSKDTAPVANSSGSTIIATQASYQLAHLLVAFSLGCALTASVMMVAVKVA